MAHSEDSLVDELRKQLLKKKPLAFCYKLHGGPYQSGLPDLLIGMERAATLLEAKWATDSDFEKPLLEVLTSKLTSQQSMNLGALGILDGPLRARVLIGGAVESDELSGGRGTLCVSFDLQQLQKLRSFKHITLLDIACYLLDLKRGERPTFEVAYLLQMQLRAEGDEWMAGHLLCGGQYFGPIDCTKDKDKAFEDA